MHDRQRIRTAVTARLLDQCGAIFGERVYPGRVGAIAINENTPQSLVDVMRSKSRPWEGSEAYDEVVDYLVTVGIVEKGAAADLAQPGERITADALDDAALAVRRALTREWGRDGGLSLPGTGRFAGCERVIEFRFVDDDTVIRPAGDAGQVAHQVLQFLVSVITPDGDPSS